MHLFVNLEFLLSVFNIFEKLLIYFNLGQIINAIKEPINSHPIKLASTLIS